MFEARAGVLHADSISLPKLAKDYGTPLYVYSATTLRERAKAWVEAFRAHPTTIGFAVKANGNLSVLRLLFKAGLGADVVSRGELERALLAGADPKRIAFSGVGKTDDELARGLAAGIHSFNVESRGELARLSAIAAARGMKARVALRINPNIDAKTHPHIATGLHSTKFGIEEDEARAIVASLAQYPGVKIAGIACHIGSQITELDPFRQAARRLREWSERVPLEFLDLGGGLGVRYCDEVVPTPAEYAKVILEEIVPTGLPLFLEPGRAIVAEAGLLLTSVIQTKTTGGRRFVMVDAAMNDLIRPSLYEAYHAIEPVFAGPSAGACDVVGPVCETSDSFGKDRELPALDHGDLVAIRHAGAYGFSMASQYNARPRAAEVLVDGAIARVVRRRERLEDLWALEMPVDEGT